jgi:hypothetical protein
VKILPQVRIPRQSEPGWNSRRGERWILPRYPGHVGGDSCSTSGQFYLKGLFCLHDKIQPKALIGTGNLIIYLFFFNAVIERFKDF